MWVFKLFIGASNSIIGKMDKFIADLFGIVVYSWKSNIRLIVIPNDQRVEIGNQDPLSDVKLPSQDDNGVFDVFLGDPLRLFTFYVVLNLDQVIVASYPSSSGKSRWLKNPNVVMTCQMVLRILCLIHL